MKEIAILFKLRQEFLSQISKFRNFQTSPTLHITTYLDENLGSNQNKVKFHRDASHQLTLELSLRAGRK